MSAGEQLRAILQSLQIDPRDVIVGIWVALENAQDGLFTNEQQTALDEFQRILNDNLEVNSTSG